VGLNIKDETGAETFLPMKIRKLSRQGVNQPRVPKAPKLSFGRRGHPSKTQQALPTAHPVSPPLGGGEGNKGSAGALGTASVPASGNGQKGDNAKIHGRADVTETLKELLALARENGYLTYDDINDVLPDGLSPDDLDELYVKLRNLDIEIVDRSEVARLKQQPEPEEEEENRVDFLDDPVRMYMNQMGKVPLLTREQEVEICKRIEDAELEMKRIVYGFGFTAKEHIAIADKLLSEPPKERFDRVIVDKKIPVRDAHLRELRRLVRKARDLDHKVDLKYLAWRKSTSKTAQQRLHADLKKLDKKLQE
jgi:RNA polymerase primary sigma factor